MIMAELHEIPEGTMFIECAYCGFRVVSSEDRNVPMNPNDFRRAIFWHWYGGSVEPNTSQCNWFKNFKHMWEVVMRGKNSMATCTRCDEMQFLSSEEDVVDPRKASDCDEQMVWRILEE